MKGERKKGRRRHNLPRGINTLGPGQKREFAQFYIANSKFKTRQPRSCHFRKLIKNDGKHMFRDLLLRMMANLTANAVTGLIEKTRNDPTQNRNRRTYQAPVTEGINLEEGGQCHDSGIHCRHCS